MENNFGKKRKVNPDAKKAMRLKYKEGISLKEAWAIVKGKSKSKSVDKKTKTGKITKKSLDTMSLKKLEELAKKYKISTLKKDKTKVKKSTLLKRLKESNKIEKILMSAKSKGKSKSTKFGKIDPLEERSGNKPDYFLKRFKDTNNMYKMSTKTPIVNYTYTPEMLAAVRNGPLGRNGTSLYSYNKFGKYLN